MSFAKMQEALLEEGWFVGWNLPGCQSCAWSSLPYEFESGPNKGKEVDYSKVLFNHSQDCEVYIEGEECPDCEGEGYDMDTDEDCMTCLGMGEVSEDALDPAEYDTSVDGFVCYNPTDCDGSYFFFDGSKEGVENLKAILPIIEASGCEVNWSGDGDSRIEINWEY